MSKNIGTNISKNLSGSYSQNLLDHAKQSASDAFTTVSRTQIQERAEAIGSLIGKKITDKTTKDFGTST